LRMLSDTSGDFAGVPEQLARVPTASSESIANGNRIFFMFLL
jgi:hypothetical protein